VSSGLAGKKRPGRFMCRWMSRLTLEVIAVRIERLHEISEADAVAEGVCSFVEANDSTPWGNLSLKDRDGLVRCQFGSAVRAYNALWDELNAKHAPWASNPFVIPITFKVHRQNIDRLKAGREAA